MLLLATGARAEVTHMNCKFNEGWHKKGGYREDAKSRKDLTLSWDKEKRIIKDTDRNFEPYNTFKDSFRWSHKWTGWYDNYTLNTINGNLTISGYNREEKWETLFYYTCDKTQKKFQMSSKKEVIFYENIYQVGPETCEYILDKGILRSDNWLDDTSYPKGIKEIKAEKNSLNQFWKRLDEINIWSWKEKYINEQAATCGHSWRLSLVNKHGKSKEIEGYEMYPHNFQKFIDALNQLFQIKIEIEQQENEQ